MLSTDWVSRTGRVLALAGLMQVGLVGRAASPRNEAMGV